jgi:hypothetical protein
VLVLELSISCFDATITGFNCKESISYCWAAHHAADIAVLCLLYSAQTGNKKLLPLFCNTCVCLNSTVYSVLDSQGPYFI